MTIARPLALAVALAAAAVPLAAQTLPGGWNVRADRANADLSAVRVSEEAGGTRVTLGPSVILWNDAGEATGAWRAEATFTQLRAPAHPEAYGLFVAGQNLRAENIDYLYVLVRGDGKFLIKHRAGAETHTITDWTAHAAVRPADADGRQTNTLAVEADAERARVLINGTEVAAFRKAEVGHLVTDGMVGLRINHNLDVRVDGFAVTRR